LNIKGLFEVAVKNLEKTSEFYTEILGFETGLLDSARRWNFL
jgi:catechol 2,3-dioxygenase-like lactoylglutathione lyase family enzyme